MKNAVDVLRVIREFLSHCPVARSRSVGHWAGAASFVQNAHLSPRVLRQLGSLHPDVAHVVEEHDHGSDLEAAGR